jgi:hypothetical protein
MEEIWYRNREVRTGSDSQDDRPLDAFAHLEEDAA